MQPFHGRYVWDQIIHNCYWAMAVSHWLRLHVPWAHTLSAGLAAALIWPLNAQQHPMLTPETPLLHKFLQDLWYCCVPGNGIEESHHIRKVAGKHRGLRERVKLVWRSMWVQQEALQIPVAKETNQQLQIRAECWERNSQFLVLEKTSMANLCSGAQH